MWCRIVVGDSRSMNEVKAGAIDLVVTSPPYWHIKDYGAAGQIGYGQTLHAYLRDLYRVWRECHRILADGGRLCINIGDQFARAAIYGRYKVIPLHAEFIAQCESLGFDFMGSIIWQKKTTVKTTGGANVMGSYPYPPNGVVEIDYEYIHIFKKPGKPRKVSRATKDASRLSKAEWKEFFSGHWRFGGARQRGHEAMFPEELPRRLVRMFSFVGDTVLDPFLGSGTTAKAALALKRSAVGYEINETFLEGMAAKLDLDRLASEGLDWLEVVRRSTKPVARRAVDYVPTIQEISPRPDAGVRRGRPAKSYKVVAITGDGGLRLESGMEATFLGVKLTQKARAIRYLKRFVLGKQVFLTLPGGRAVSTQVRWRGHDPVAAYVHLKNRIFVNTYLIRSGLASASSSPPHRLSEKFLALSQVPTSARDVV
jgi:DNA modification methylase